jgi:hypothetical protein
MFVAEVIEVYCAAQLPIVYVCMDVTIYYKRSSKSLLALNIET